MNTIKKYFMPILLFVVFEAVAVTLWLVKDTSRLLLVTPETGGMDRAVTETPLFRSPSASSRWYFCPA